MILTGFATGTFVWFLLSPNSKRFVRSRGNSVFAVIYCTCFNIWITFLTDECTNEKYHEQICHTRAIFTVI